MVIYRFFTNPFTKWKDTESKEYLFLCSVYVDVSTGLGSRREQERSCVFERLSFSFP